MAWWGQRRRRLRPRVSFRYFVDVKQLQKKKDAIFFFLSVPETIYRCVYIYARTASRPKTTFMCHSYRLPRRKKLYSHI